MEYEEKKPKKRAVSPLRILGMDGYADKLSESWESLKYDWRSYRRNTPARRAFRQGAVRLDSVQNRVLAELRDRGIAKIPLVELMGDSSAWNTLDRDFREWYSHPDVEQKKNTYRNATNRRWKDYLVRKYDAKSVVGLADVWLRFGLEHRVLDIVNTYLGLLSKIVYMDVWCTVPLPAHSEISTGSQLWHRDPEDRRLVKVFLLFSDVDGSAGPMHYIPQSRRGDKYGGLWQRVPPAGGRPPDDASLERAIPRTEWAICTEPRGTLLFADTSGLHMGGRATERERHSAVWAYTGHGSYRQLNFKLDVPADAAGLSTAQRFALWMPPLALAG